MSNKTVNIITFINKVFSQTLERPKDIAGEITIFVNDSEASIPTPTELH